MSPTLEEVVADLARRVAALEAGGAPSAGTEPLGGPSTGSITVPTGPSDPPDPLWALHALQARLAGSQRVDGGLVLTGVVPLAGGGTALWQEDRSPAALLDADPTTTAGRLHALGSPVRLRLLREVLQGRTGSGELAADPAFGTSGQVNHHLRQLVAAGWLRPTARGHHAVPTERVVPLLAALAAAGG